MTRIVFEFTIEHYEKGESKISFVRKESNLQYDPEYATNYIFKGKFQDVKREFILKLLHLFGMPVIFREVKE